MKRFSSLLKRFSNLLGGLLTGLFPLGLSRPSAAETQLLFSTPPKGAVVPLGMPFYLSGQNNSGSVDVDIHSYKQIRVVASVDHTDGGARVQLLLELYEGGQHIGNLDALEFNGPCVPDPSVSPPLTATVEDLRRGEGSVTRVYDAPGRTLRLRVIAPGYTTYGPDRTPAGNAIPHTVPQAVTVAIYGTPG